MGRKAPKASRKLAAKGELKRRIRERHKYKNVRNKIKSRKDQAAAKTDQNGRRRKDERTRSAAAVGRDESEDDDDQEEEEEEVDERGKSSKGRLTVDDLLNARFTGEEGENEESDEDDSDGQESENDDNDMSFASVDDLSDEGEAHLHDLARLAETDPEFYKYLQENDQDLLDFDPDVARGGDEEVVSMQGDGDDLSEKAPVLTMDILKRWQKALLEQRSLRALRKLLIAFRSAAHVHPDGEGDVNLAWRIDSPSVFRKLVTTSLRYTPVILGHHIPYKALPNGKFKQPASSKKYNSLTKLLLSHFHNVLHVLSSLPQHSTDESEEGRDVEMTILVLKESAKLLPYVIGSRKAVKIYLKTCLSLWSSAQDTVRVAAFLAIRRLASSTDESILDLVLKGTYLTLVRSSKTTTAHSLPSITLMKNTTSELYCSPEHEDLVYQRAFGYIRQLAILLRGGMKSMSKESYKQVYNWQFVHCVDFWSLVLARACDEESLKPPRHESELKPLVYPLVQVSLGAIQLIATPRSYPFHLQIIRSLLHLSRRTSIFIPLAPQILPVLHYSLAPSTSGKKSTLRPLPLDTCIRAPAPYLRTRVYAETLVDEAVYILAEWLAIAQVQGSIAFPEISVPIAIALRKGVKETKGAKQADAIKALLERMEAGAKWVEERRRGVTFAPSDTEQVRAWQDGIRERLEEAPMVKGVNLLKKQRDKRARLLEKAREGEDEILDS